MWLIGTTYGTYDLTNKEIRASRFLTCAQQEHDEAEGIL
jgi:hypothetical protein